MKINQNGRHANWKAMDKKLNKVMLTISKLIPDNKMYSKSLVKPPDRIEQFLKSYRPNC